ncbi:MAG TPA: ABC transporter permease [Nevskiaceae bacterium]|nr:ABC transporter permease [Nevskiaceae bacterium]
MRTILAVTLMNLRSIPSRLGTSLVIVVGIAGVVAVLIALLSMSKGFEKTLKGTGADGRAIVINAGSTSELASYLQPDVVSLLRTLPAVKRDVEGKPLASAELLVITELRKGEGPRAASVNVALRGVEPMGLKMRPEVKLMQGRVFEPGLHEVIAGRSATEQFEGIKIGNKLKFRGSEWTVVGIFDSDRDAHESELWTDADTARNAFGRPGASSVLAQLESPAAFKAFKDSITTDPRFQVDVSTERDYFTSQSESLTSAINILTNVISIIMAFGALFGALNTMYSAVATRSVEIATLRAIGFSGAPVVASVLAEAVLLALAGGMIGAAISYTLFNGMSVSTLGGSFTQIAFSFMVTPDLVERGLTWAVLLGLIGGLLPAIRAARLPVVEALRAA